MELSKITPSDGQRVFLFPMTTYLIFANGIIADPIETRRYIQTDATIICADGGTQHALAMGLTPHTIVGDLDSLPADTVHQMRTIGVEIIEHPVKKDETDLELALSLAIARGATEILLLGMLGGRLDQHLANLLLLTRPEWASARLRLADGNQQAWLLRGDDRLTLTGSPGDTLSIVPLTAQINGLSITGAEWVLAAASIPLGSSRTISNTFVASKVSVQLKYGIALIIIINH